MCNVLSHSISAADTVLTGFVSVSGQNCYIASSGGYDSWTRAPGQVQGSAIIVGSNVEVLQITAASWFQGVEWLLVPAEDMSAVCTAGSPTTALPRLPVWILLPR